MNIWQKLDGAIPLILEVQYNFTPISGIIPTVEIRRFSDDFYADFGTFTFRNSGGVRNTPMSGEIGRPGVYRKDFNPGDFGENDKRQLYIMNYKAHVPSGYNSDITSDIDFSSHEVNFFGPMSSGTGSSGGMSGMTADFVG